MAAVTQRPANNHFGASQLAYTTDAMWWFWRLFKLLEPTVELGGTYAAKSGFHNTGQANLTSWPGNYSVYEVVNRSGPWWLAFCAAIDLTFPDAQRGDYRTINKYTGRLSRSARDDSDPRLGTVLFEYYGQEDADSQVEGYNEYYEEIVTSDPSHLWHLHLSILRSMCGNFDALWALYTVLAGWSVQQWRDGGGTAAGGEDEDMAIANDVAEWGSKPSGTKGLPFVPAPGSPFRELEKLRDIGATLAAVRASVAALAGKDFVNEDEIAELVAGKVLAGLPGRTDADVAELLVGLFGEDRLARIVGLATGGVS